MKNEKIEVLINKRIAPCALIVIYNSIIMIRTLNKEKKDIFNIEKSKKDQEIKLFNQQIATLHNSVSNKISESKEES